MRADRRGLPDTAASFVEGPVRLDVWLWRARFFKTRQIAADAIVGGHLRVDRAGQVRRITKPGQTAQPGDVLVIGKGTAVMVVKMLAVGTRRGPAEEARALYLDMTAPVQHDRGTAHPFKEQQE